RWCSRWSCWTSSSKKPHPRMQGWGVSSAAGTRREWRRPQPSVLLPLGRVWRVLRELRQADFNCAVQLHVYTPNVVLRAVVHLDVRVRAVVLDVPADIVEEKRELRL